MDMLCFGWCFSGEVSYVLIVQQNEDKKVIPDQQSEVYEFEGEDSDLEEDMDNKGKVLKTLRKSHLNQGNWKMYIILCTKTIFVFISSVSDPGPFFLIRIH